MESEERKLKLAVVYPWSSEFGYTKSFHSMLCLRHPPDVEIAWGRGFGWCSAARHNHVFRQALNWGADIIVMLGADQVYHDRDLLVKMVEHYRNGHECVTALVPMRGYMASQGMPPFSQVGWRIKPDENGNTNIFEGMDASNAECISAKDGPLVRIHSGGTGVLMFPADVLRTMSTPWCAEVPTQPDFDRGTTADVGFITKLQAECNLEIMCDTTIKVTHLHPFEIDETFQHRFLDWMEPGKGDPTLCDYKTKPRADGVIDQVRVSPCIPFFADKFKDRYKLNSYTRHDQPAFFFGCYTQEDLIAVMNHKSTAVVIWAGSDIIGIRNAIEQSKEMPFGPNVKHVAISKFIAEDLDAVGLKYVRLPLCCVDESKFKATPVQGKNGIYVMLPTGDEIKYGGKFINELQKLLPEFDWIIHSHRNSTPDEMAAIYADCFMGVRPLQHDGLSNSCVELGLMGRWVLWNGDSPNAVQYKSLEDAASQIKMVKGYSDHNSVLNNSSRVRGWLDIGEAWKTTEYFDPPKLGIVNPEHDKYDYKTYFDWRYSSGPTGAGGPEPGNYEDNWTQAMVRKLVEDYKCGDVTEVGVGAAVRWTELPARDYVGFDVSPVAIQHAKKKFPNSGFYVADVTKDKIAPADAVICLDVLQHIAHEDFMRVVNKLCEAARKVVIIKTSVDIPELHYQFSHNWSEIQVDKTFNVPNSRVSRLFIIEVNNGQSRPENQNGNSDQSGDRSLRQDAARADSGDDYAGGCCETACGCGELNALP